MCHSRLNEAASHSKKGRLGSSVDQDGKSNIWAVEPKMAVDQDAGASGGGLFEAPAAGEGIRDGMEDILDFDEDEEESAAR